MGAENNYNSIRVMIQKTPIEVQKDRVDNKFNEFFICLNKLKQ